MATRNLTKLAFVLLALTLLALALSAAKPKASTTPAAGATKSTTAKAAKAKRPRKPRAAPTGDPLAPVKFWIGEWEGTGKSTVGPYYLHYTVKQENQWIIAYGEVYDKKGGKMLDGVIQTFGANRSGRLVTYTFDSTGEAAYHGKANSSGGSFSWKRKEATRAMSWKVNGDGTVSQHIEYHLPDAPDPFKNFIGDDTDHRIGQ